MKDPSAQTANPGLAQTIKSQPVQEDGKNLSMRLGEQLYLEIPSTKERLRGDLVGFKREAFLLVWLPALTRYRQALIEDNSIIVRGLNSDFQLCGFMTTILKTMVHPYPLLLLSIPKVFEKLYLRRHDREQCLLPALMIFNEREYKAIIINLSSGGAKIVLEDQSFETSADTLLNQEVFSVFKTVEHGSEIYAKTLVRSVYNNEGRIMLGTEFIELVGDAEDDINKYVTSIKAYSNL
jgi:c-di-GMP-binding flagellar brake protein YcgR